MKRSDFNVALASSFLAAAAPSVAQARTKKPYQQPHGVPGIKPRSRMNLTRDLMSTSEVIPVEHTFGDPVYFVWDPKDGSVSIPGKDLIGELANMYPSSTKTVYVSISIPYLHASSYFTKPPNGSNPRVKQVIQFKPTVNQIQELPELQKQPLSWSPVMKFDATSQPDGYMYSGPFKADALTTLQAMPIQSGLGSFSFAYAGTALNKNHVLSALDTWLTKLNAIGKVAAGIPGVVISASTVVAFGIAQNVVDQVAAILSDGAARNEMAMDAGTHMFAVTQVDGAHLPSTLRIPKAGIQYILVPGGGLHPGDSQADAFFKNLTASKLKVMQNASGDLYAVNEDGSEAAGFFDPYNYAVLQIALSDTPPSAGRRERAL